MVQLENRSVFSYHGPDGNLSIRFESEGSGSRRCHPGDISKLLSVYRDGVRQEGINVPNCTEDDLRHLEDRLARVANDRPAIDEFYNDLYFTIDNMNLE